MASKEGGERVNIIDAIAFGAILLLVYYAYASYKLNTYNPYEEESE